MTPNFSQSVTQSEPVPPDASELMSSKPGVYSYCATSQVSLPDSPSLHSAAQMIAPPALTTFAAADIPFTA